MAICDWCMKVFLSKDGRVTVVPPETNYEPQEGEVQIQEVRDVKVHFPIDGAIVAEIELYPRLTKPLTGARPKFFLGIDGVLKEIVSVEFADGKRWPI